MYCKQFSMEGCNGLLVFDSKNLWFLSRNQLTAMQILVFEPPHLRGVRGPPEVGNMSYSMNDPVLLGLRGHY